MPSYYVYRKKTERAQYDVYVSPQHSPLLIPMGIVQAQTMDLSVRTYVAATWPQDSPSVHLLALSPNHATFNLHVQGADLPPGDVDGVNPDKVVRAESIPIRESHGGEDVRVGEQVRPSVAVRVLGRAGKRRSPRSV